MTEKNGATPWKFNITPENLPGPKRKVVFQPSFFRGELLHFGGVVSFADKLCALQRTLESIFASPLTAYEQ